ncbi:rubrerythrin-like domain-containing protein [Natronorarus salvus]
MFGTDPYSPTAPYYECPSCSERTIGREHLGRCSSCGSRVRNLAVARE